MTFKKKLILAATGLLLSSPVAFAAEGNGTTLAGGDNGKAAKQDSNAKTGGAMSKDGAMSKSDGMKKDGMMKTDGGSMEKGSGKM